MNAPKANESDNSIIEPTTQSQEHMLDLLLQRVIELGVRQAEDASALSDACDQIAAIAIETAEDGVKCASGLATPDLQWLASQTPGNLSAYLQDRYVAEVSTGQ